MDATAIAPAPAPAHHLLEAVTIRPARLPVTLTGLRILQVTDLHIRRRRRRFQQVIRLVEETEHDLLLLTGDYMDRPGDEPVAHEIVSEIVAAASPTIGTFGVFGNHDTPDIRHRFADLPVHWLNNAGWASPRWPLAIVGIDCGENEPHAPRGDLLGAIADLPDADDGDRLTLLLAHMPDWLPAASRMDVDVVLSGHTHGGQCRLGPRKIFYNATPGWPLAHSTGILQCGSTLGIISRGLGESLCGLRLLCPPHVPLITLGQPDQPLTATDETVCLAPW